MRFEQVLGISSYSALQYEGLVSLSCGVHIPGLVGYGRVVILSIRTDALKFSSSDLLTGCPVEDLIS